MPVLTKINTNVIAEDAITGDKFAGDAYLSNTANQNISGTYSENRMYTSDAYTLSGNATINSNLVLSSTKPTGDVVLTASGAYTITGTGTLSGGSMYGRQTLTGMTGELGSTVTGSPNLNLGAISFPSGKVNNVFRFSDTSTAALNIQTTTTTVAGVFSFSATSGRHYVIVGSQYMSPYRYGGNHDRRYQRNAIYWGTTARTSLDTTVDNLIFAAWIGQTFGSASTSEAPAFYSFSYNGSFTAASTAPHYVYTAISTSGADDRARAYSNADHPHIATIFEVMP